jgi:hypothetical protein
MADREDTIDDRQPGAALRVRRMTGDSRAVLIPVVGDDARPARDLLIVRWDRLGQMYAALVVSVKDT